MRNVKGEMATTLCYHSGHFFADNAVVVSSAAPSPAELLVSTDSITACLRRLCRELTVELLWQGESELSADEQQWLGASARGWVREVCLRGDGQPWLLARRMKSTYLTDTTQINDQNTSERMPSTPSMLACTPKWPLNTSLRVYNGLVPMSP